MIKIELKDFLKLTKEDISKKLIAFSTDTVFGVGVLVDQNVMDGVNKIYQMKKRDLNKPLAVLISDIKQVEESININEQAKKLIPFWPGALTIIFEKKNNDIFPFTKDTIGLRIPNSKIALSILNHFGPFVTTSINYSGESSINSPEEIDNKFHEYIDYLVIDNEERSNVSSTVVDVSKKDIKILRQGTIKIS